MRATGCFVHGGGANNAKVIGTKRRPTQRFTAGASGEAAPGLGFGLAAKEGRGPGSKVAQGSGVLVMGSGRSGERTTAFPLPIEKL